MLNPEADIEDRTPIWGCLQDIFMDTDVTLSYPYIVSTCCQSKYSIEELQQVLFQEVLPALRINLYALPAPEWRGFEIQWLVDRVLKKHKFGQNKPWIGRVYANHHWQQLKPKLEQARAKRQ